MRAALLVVLSVLVLAGCVSPATPPGPVSPGTNLEGWALDCTLGTREPGWPQPCAVQASHTDGPKAELWLAVNPTNPDNVVIGAKDLNPASSAKCVWNGVSVTQDGGKTWSDVVIGGTYASRQPGDPYFGYACNTDPDLVFTKDGIVHYVVEMYNLGGQDSHGPLGPDPTAGRALLLPGWKLVLATSPDGGDTWPQTVTLDQTEGVAAINDYSRMTVNPATGSILTMINTFSGGPFILAGQGYSVCDIIASRDGGVTADAPNRVLPQDANERQLGCQVITAAPDGTVVVGAANGGNTRWAQSTDDARTFSAWAPGFTFTPIAGTFNESQYRTGVNFEVAYDLTEGPAKGTLYCLYADGGNGDADVMLRASKDNGKTWSDAVRVNDDNTDHDQFMGNLVVADDGSIHAFFLDKRWDPANKLVDVTHAVSTDRGATWHNERVTNVSWDGDLGRHQEGFPFLGDYNGIGQAKNVVWGAFPDASNGNTTVVAAARVARVG